MNWTFLIVTLVVTSTAYTHTLKSHYGQNSSATVRKTRQPINLAALTKWELQTIKQLQKINKLIRNLKSENGCSKGVNTPQYCQLHWLPDTLLRLSARIDNKNNEVQLQTEGEKEIHEKHLMINTLIENMVSVTGCSKDKEEKKKDEERKKALGKASKSQDKKGKGGEAKAEDDKKKAKEKTTETEEKKKESKEAGVPEGQIEAEDKVTPPEVSKETPPGSSDGKEETSAGETEGEEEKETGEGDPAEETGDEDTEETEDVEEEEKTSGCDYSQFGPLHTMLKPRSSCEIHKTGLDEGDKEEILRLHNNLRAKVARGEETEGNPGPQPPAANMRELVWNDQLAEVAEAWAKQCKQGHDQVGERKICSRNYFVGQNLHFYYGPSPVVDWENAVNEWYNEVADLPNEIAASYRSLLPIKIGHYTQVVWADTTEIGCGIVHYQIEYSGRFFPEAKLYACNYGQAGNVVTFPIYQQGPAASQCPNGVSENYPDLCA
ncbi:uncharacterized protein LOC135220714 [Macrobrachium nipponense]|uniref:uncharacterized protein LOC135220714 n=1 Tax=Macrobrachium nipponense TaxID=159736 RepID=UPI0030C8CFDC